MAEALLEVRQLSRRFAAIDALQAVDFNVEAGEVHALIGPNGAGKTTFIHHVSGAMTPDSGSVHFGGTDVTALSMHQRVAAGMAEQRLFEEARDFLEQVGLGSRNETVASKLAHGEQRALELAMALATKPRMLLLDEPMAGAGPEESAHMVELIEKLARHVTILLVEHDMAAVFRLADRISVLVNGQLICTGEPEAVRANPEVRRAYLGDHL